jgi:hypothetical protein
MNRDSSLASLPRETAVPSTDALSDAAELAGSALAHAVWCMSEEDEGPFAPTVAYDGAEGRKFLMFDDEDYDAAVERGQAWMAANPQGATRAVLVCDGYTDRNGTLVDALIAEVVDYGGQQSFIVTVPYRPVASEAGFAVFGARFMLADEAIDQAPLLAAFGRGIATHEDAAAAWINHFDNTTG